MSEITFVITAFEEGFLYNIPYLKMHSCHIVTPPTFVFLYCLLQILFPEIS